MNGKVFDRAVTFLGLVLLLCVGGIVYLNATSHSPDDVLKSIAVGSMTGLVGLLVQKGQNPDDPVPVTLQDEPIETTEVAPKTKKAEKK